MTKHVRHGDVLLVAVDSIPKDAKEVKHAGRFVLAEGETTGHKHVAVVGKPEDMKVFKDAAGTIFMKMAVDVPLTHEEHQRVEIPMGTWKMVFEQEHDYFKEAHRQVID